MHRRAFLKLAAAAGSVAAVAQHCDLEKLIWASPDAPLPSVPGLSANPTALEQLARETLQRVTTEVSRRWPAWQPVLYPVPGGARVGSVVVLSEIEQPTMTDQFHVLFDCAEFRTVDDLHKYAQVSADRLAEEICSRRLSVFSVLPLPMGLQEVMTISSVDRQIALRALRDYNMHEPERWEPEDEPEEETPHVPPMLEREVRELPPIEERGGPTCEVVQ